MHCGANVSTIRQRVDMFLVLASGIRVPGTNFALKVAKNIEFLKMFHPKELFLPFYKKNFLKIYLWNMEHRPSKCYYCYISTLLDDFFVPNLFQRLEQMLKTQ
jgi:hypothetical protein